MQVAPIVQHLNELAEKFNQANEGHAANYTAIVYLLIEKGLITEEEYEAARMVTIQQAEQEWARKRDEKEST